MYRFTQDWVEFRPDIWRVYLKDFIGISNLRMLEIGSYEGRSTIWFLENVLTHPTATITCIDPFFQPLFYSNIIRFKHKVKIVNEFSQQALRDQVYLNDQMDLIYVDGDHRASLVLEDAVLSFRILKKNGIIIFDDYLWKKNGELFEPKLAIDSFLKCYCGQYQILYSGYQVVLRKSI